MHLDNFKGKDKDIAREQTDNKTEGFVIYVTLDITTKMNTMNQMNIKKMLTRRNFWIRSGEIKLMSWD